ncbi:methyltransferase domain-containing protein, partial [Planococcus sp. SIMBA_143]
FDTFFQTNPLQAEKLVDLAIEMAEVTSEERMIDLFCGVGTFSLPFAKRVEALAGIEIVETSIESAKRNAEDNGLDNTYFLTKDARRGM